LTWISFSRAHPVNHNHLQFFFICFLGFVQWS
jgi:hypothetical protein